MISSETTQEEDSNKKASSTSKDSKTKARMIENSLKNNKPKLSSTSSSLTMNVSKTTNQDAASKT